MALQPYNGEISPLDDGIVPLRPYDGELKPMDYEPSPKPEGKGIVGHARDLGLSALKSAIAVPEVIVGLADIPTGGAVGKFLENKDGAFGFRPKEAKDILSDLHTDQYKAQQREFQEADGVLDKTAVALQNPSLIANTVVESAAPMLAGGVAARGIRALAPGVSTAAAGALGEGATMAGAQAEAIRQQTDDGLLTAEQSGAAVATGALGTLFGYAGGRLAQRLGIGDVDTMLARGAASANDVAAEIARLPAKSIPRQVIEGAITEGFLEELPQSISEQIIQNLALNKAWSDGVADAAVMGTLAGMAMGGGAALARGLTAPPRPDEQGGSQPQADQQAAPPPAESIFSTGDAPVLDGRALERAGVTLPPPAPVLNAGQLDRWIDPIQAPALKPSEQMGLDPAAGPMSAAAALAVDSGASPVVSPAAAPAQTAAGRPNVNLETGEIVPPDARATEQPVQTPEQMRERLAFIEQQARMNGGWDRRLVEERDRLRGELAKVAPAANQDQIKNESPAVAGAAQAQPVPDQGFNVSGRTDQQLQHLAQNGQPGWKDAAQAEIQRRATGAAPASAASASTTTNEPAQGQEQASALKALLSKQIPDMSDAELQQAIGNYGPEHKRTAKLVKEVQKRAQAARVPAQTSGAPSAALESSVLGTSGARWDAMTAEARAELLTQKGGWNTSSGGLNVIGKGLLGKGWKDVPDSAKARIERLVAERDRVPAATGATTEQAPAAPASQPDPVGMDAAAPAAAPAQPELDNAKKKPTAVRKPQKPADPSAARWLEMTLAEREAVALSIGQRGIFAQKTAEKRWERLPAKVRESLAAKLGEGAPVQPAAPEVAVSSGAHFNLEPDNAPAQPQASTPQDQAGGESAAADGALNTAQDPETKRDEVLTRFANNKLFTADKVAAARERMRKKLGTLNSGIDPELLMDGMTIAGAYIESGVRNFTQYAKIMVEDMGEGVKPYLLSFWEGARNYPGVDNAGMTSAEESRRQFDALLAPADTKTEAVGEVAEKPKKRARKTGAKADMTLTQDWGVDHIDGYGDESRETGNDTKDAFLKEARAYLNAVAERLGEQGFVPHDDAKGRAEKPVRVNEAGPAVSGDVSLTVRHPGTDANVYVTVGAASLRGTVPTTPSGIAVMYRVAAGGDRYATKSTNTWAPVDLSAADLAAAISERAQAIIQNEKKAATAAGENADADAERIAQDAGGRAEEPQSQPVQPTADGRGARSADRAADGRVQREHRRGDAGGDESARADAGQHGEGSVDEQPAGGGRGSSAAAGDRADRRDFRIQPGSLTRTGSWKATAEQNVRIVELVKRLIAEGRPATQEERALLTKFTGWGASEIANGIFPNERTGQYKEGWQELGERLKAALTPDEYAQAKRTTQYAHYTSEPIIRSIYDAVERLGFAGGKVVEPGMGVGLFKGLMPGPMASVSDYTGVEYDTITGNIAKLLYPSSNVIVGDYAETRLPRDFFDVAIGNPPFGQIKIQSDPEYRKHGFLLHDYFFAKTIDRVRPGGLLVFVTSKGTMDKATDRARAYLAERADLIGAIRLPQTAFKGNAGTEVVTDVIFLRKREEGQAPAGEAWAKLAEVQTPQGSAQINEYFAAHPEMVLGRHALTGSMYRANEYTVEPMEGDIEQHFAKAVQNLPEGIYRPARGSAAEAAVVQRRDFDPKVRKEGGIYVADDGTLMQVENGSGLPLRQRLNSAQKLIDLKPREVEWLKGWTAVRGALKQAQADQLNDGDWEASLKALNEAYDRFVKAHGPILAHTVIEREAQDGSVTVTRRFKNEPLFRLDAEGALAQALETINPDGSIRKSPMLLGRTLNKPRTPEITNARDAMFVSLNEQGRFDIAHIAKLAGKPEAEVIAELGDSIFEAPGQGWTTADDYLSGNVVRKLREAEVAARLDKRYARNVEALKSVQPRALAPQDITVQLGSAWIPPSDITAFASEVMGDRLEVRYNPLTGQWTVDGAASRASEWGTEAKPAHDILEAALNNRQIKVTYRDTEGKTYTDAEATEKANDVAKKLRSAFRSWIWSDPDRTDRLAKFYNENFNNIAPRQYDGSHLTLPGVSSLFQLRPHQKRAIWRTIQDGDTYYAHAVGAGKTFTMIAAGMEERRLGLAKKPMYVVPNHMLAQFSKEFLELYPAAQIMVADETNFHTHNRRRFVAQAALNDPDAIIITHSAFGRIGMSAEFSQRFIEDQISEWQMALEEVDSQDRVTRKQIERRIEQLENRLKGIIDGDSKDQLLSFEELGVDRLYVDEGHEFRKLDFATNRGNIKGIDPSGSQRAMDLFMKISYLRQKNPRRALVMASGTPVTNTMGELFTVQRFFQPSQLDEDGDGSFDAWSNHFGEVVEGLEQNAAGGYEAVSRFAKFVNVPELMSRVRTFMDILTSNQLGDLVQRPDAEGGGRQVVVTPPPDGYKAYQKDLEARIKAIRNRRGPPKPGDDIILNVIADGRFSAIDMRFVDPSLPSDPNSKLNRMLDDVIETYHRTANNTYTTNGRPDELPGSSLMIFTDIGLGEQSAKSRGFDMKAWIEQRLVEGGVNPAHIAFMRDHKAHAKKERLFDDLRQGRKRILIGGKDMETGVNAQKRLIYLGHLDAPWFPASVEQREGRIVRQGNQNKRVTIKGYATKGSYDSTMWGMNARKARFIEQAMTGDTSMRSMEDVSEASAFEMAAALASGDERYMKLAGLKADVDRLGRLYSAHLDEQRSIRSRKMGAETSLKHGARQADAIREAIAKRKPIESGKFLGKVDGKVFDKRDDFSMALAEKFRDLASTYDDATKVIGELGGFRIVYVGAFMRNDHFVADVTMDLPSAPDPLMVYPIDENASITGIGQRAVNQVNGLDRALAETEKRIEQAESDLERLERRLGAAFPEMAELQEKREALDALTAELAAEGEAANADAAAATVEVEDKETDAAPSAPGGQGDAPQFSFAGRSASGADLHALGTAQRRIAAGEDEEAVRQETGWHRGADGKWRFEISDDQAQIAVGGDTAAEVLEAAALDGGPVRVADVLDHPQLFAAYPQLADILVELVPAGERATGRMIRTGDDVRLQIRGDVKRAMMVSVMLHELQHGIQHAEGFARGGSKKALVSDLDRTGADTYRRLAGEVEARNTQYRQRMTAEQRRMIAPEDTADVSASDVIVVLNGKRVAAAPMNTGRRATVTEAGLLRALRYQFRGLVKPVQSMLARGRRGKKGGLVMIDSADPLRVASVFASKTGRSLDSSIDLFSESGDVNGFYDPKSGLTFLVGPNLDPVTAPAVLLHEMIHGQQKARIDAQAMDMLMNRAKVRDAALRAFLDRVAQRMVDADAATDAKEAAAYIVEQAVMEGRSRGYTMADSRFFGWADATFGKRLGDFLRSVAAMVRTWMIRHGGIKALAVDDLVGYAMAGLDRAAGGAVTTGGTAQHSRSAMKDTAANIRRGLDALAKAVTEKTSIHRAMFRNGLGWVDFVWGSEGRVKPSGKAKGAMGLSHIYEARQRKDGMSVTAVDSLLSGVVTAIARGQEVRRDESGPATTVVIEHSGTEAVLTKRAGSNAWLLSGWKVNPGARRAGSVATAATPLAPTTAQNEGGAGFDSSVVAGRSVGNDGIQFSRTGARSPQQVAKHIGDGLKSITVQDVKRAGRHKLTDWLKLGLQFLGRRQLVDIYGDVLPLAEYDRLAAQMEADKNDVGAAADDLARRWGKLPDEGRLADLMHDATLAQIDADSAVAYAEGDDRMKSRMLKAQFNALTPEAQQVYREARDHYKKHHAAVRQAIIDRIERSELRSARRAELMKRMDDDFFKAIKGVYFPLARFGQYVVVAKDGAGKVASVSRAETMAEAEALRREMVKAFPASEGYQVGRVILSKEFVASRDMVGRGFMTELYGALDEQNLPPEQLAELEDTLGQLYLSSLPDLSWAKHGIHRKGTPGFSQDARRAFAQNTFHGARYLAKLKYGDRMQTQLDGMQKHVDLMSAIEDFDQPAAQRVVDEMAKRHDALMNPKSNPISTALTSFGFIYYLGLSPAAAVVNLSQTPLVAYPVLGSKWGFKKAGAALMRASRESVQGKNDMRGQLKDADEIRAYDEAVRSGVIDVTMAHDLAGIAQGEDAKVMWKIRPVMRLASYLFHHAERFNRQATFMAAYRLAREAGAGHDASYSQAVKATYDGHFDYSAGNRARVMQGNVARVVLLFKQYAQNMLFTIARNAYQSVAGESPEVRKEARRIFGALMVMHAAAAGVLGLPLVGTLLTVASALGGSDDEPWDAEVALRNLLADAFGPKVSEVVARGFSRLTPWDISGRVGLDKLLLPDVQEGLEGQRWAESVATAMLGPVIGMGVNAAKAAQKMADGDYGRGLEDLLPIAARNPIKAYRYWDEGAQDRTGVEIKGDVGLAGVLGQAAGFSPSEVRLAFEGRSAVMDQDRRLAERRSELMGRFARAAMDQDQEEMDEARAAIAEFNQKNPGRRITAPQMWQSVRARQRRIDRAEDGVYLPRTRQDAMEAGRFAEV